MNDDRTPRNLKERSGKHLCIECLKEVPSEEYLRNDYVCNECGEKKEERADADADRGHP